MSVRCAVLVGACIGGGAASCHAIDIANLVDKTPTLEVYTPQLRNLNLLATRRTYARLLCLLMGFILSKPLRLSEGFDTGWNQCARRVLITDDNSYI